jgi:hypothetical protein
VIDYCRKKNYIYVNPETFIAHYETVGWKVGKNKMQNWRSSVSGWESREREKQGYSAQNAAAGASSGTKKEDGTYWG